VLLQLLLPSSLAPDTEKAGLGQTWKKLTGPWHRDFASQLGIPSLHGFWLFVVFAIAIAGLLWRLVTATRDDLGIAVFAVLSMTIVGMIDANSIRYLMSITPWALYFGVQALSALRVPRKERTRQFGPIIAAAAMVLLVVHHSTQLPLAIKATDSTNATMPTADGPESAYVQPAWTAVRKYTHTQDVVAFWRARALTLYTDRRGIQTSDLALVNQQADFFLMRRNFSFFQPLVSDAEAAAMGWKNVWQDSKWVLWQVRQPFG